VEGIRLRCRAHNQYEAECVFGAGFMASKREAARLAAAEARARTAAARAAAAEEHARAAAEKREKAAAEAQAAAAERDPARSVVPWLRQLGVRMDDARRAAAYCESVPARGPPLPGRFPEPGREAPGSGVTPCSGECTRAERGPGIVMSAAQPHCTPRSLSAGCRTPRARGRARAARRARMRCGS